MLRIKPSIPINFYSKNKILFIEEQNGIKDITKQIYFDMLINYVLPYEMNKEKDLCEFTSEEIRDIIRNLPVLKERNIRTLFSAIKKYESWATSRGLCPLGNPCESIDVRELMNLDKETKEEIYIKLDNFWKTIDKYNKEFDIGYQNLIIPIMYRYGVQSNWINYIKFEDIDYKDKLLTIYEDNRREKVLTVLPIDDRFIESVNKAKNDEGIEYEFKENAVMSKTYVNHGYIIMSTTKSINNNVISESENIIVPTSSIYTRYNKIFKTTKDVRYRIRDLNGSRKFDILLSIYNKNKEVTMYDIEDIFKMYSGKESTMGVLNLKNDFEASTDIKVVTKHIMKSRE